MPRALEWTGRRAVATTPLLEQYNGLGYASKAAFPGWSGNGSLRLGKYIADGSVPARLPWISGLAVLRRLFTIELAMAAL